MIRLICMTDFTEKYAVSILRGILRYSQETEPWVICKMPPVFCRKHGVAGVIDWAKDWKADAIIGQFEPTDDLSLFGANGIVAIAQDYKQRFQCIPNITSDYRLAGRQAAEYFVGKGFSHFAFYGYENVVWSDERWEGFSQYLKEMGMGDDVSDYRHQSIDQLWYYDGEPLIKWLKSLTHPVALFAADDSMASKIVEACNTCGLRIPSDVAVLGVDNDEIICGLTYPELSSMNMSVEKAGYETAQLIHRLVINPHALKEDIYVRSLGVVERSSTDIIAANNPYIQQALQFIHSNLSRQLYVRDIISRLPMSRRLFEQRFFEETGTSPHNYITNLRMSRLAQLLLTSDESIDELAMSVGVADGKNLSRQFKARMGMNPKDYRKKYKIVKR